MHQLTQKVEVLLDFLDQCCNVGDPVEVLADAHSKEFCTAHYPHCSTIYSQWQVLAVASLKVYYNLLCLADIQHEDLVSAPHGSRRSTSILSTSVR